MRSAKTIREKIKKAGVLAVSRRTGISRETLYRFLRGEDIRLSTFSTIDAELKKMEAEKNG